MPVARRTHAHRSCAMTIASLEGRSVEEHRPEAVVGSQCTRKSHGRRPTLTAAFGGSVRRAPPRPSSAREATGRGPSGARRSRETSTASGRTGPPLRIRVILVPRGARSRFSGHQKGGGARGIASQHGHDEIPRAAPPFHARDDAAARGLPRRCAAGTSSGPGGRRGARRTIFAAAAIVGGVGGTRETVAGGLVVRLLGV